MFLCWKEVLVCRTLVAKCSMRLLHQLRVPETTVLGPFAETSGTVVVGKIIDQ